MPICTTCTHPTAYLYTVYQSAYNLRLEQCTECGEFADPYVEHDTLTLLLDLILLKRDVFRHLLFNRGSGARIAVPPTTSEREGDRGEIGEDDNGKRKNGEKVRDEAKVEVEKTWARWMIILKLGSALVLVDAFIRWSHLNPTILSQNTSGGTSDSVAWTHEHAFVFLRILIGSLIETVAFHTGIIFSCYVVLGILEFIRSRRHRIPDEKISGIRQEFRLSHVPLTLLYSSLTKLFLLFLLSIWRPGTVESTEEAPPRWNVTEMHPIVAGALEMLDEENLNREWVVRNVLGGMSAGFGLRVVLDCHSVFTTIIILAGWAVKTAVANFVSEWVGGDSQTGETWLAYSIP